MVLGSISSSTLLRVGNRPEATLRDSRENNEGKEEGGLNASQYHLTTETAGGSVTDEASNLGEQALNIFRLD